MKKIFKKIIKPAVLLATFTPIISTIACGTSYKFDTSKKDSLIQIVGPNGHKDGAFQQMAWNGLEKGQKEFENFKSLSEIKAQKSDQKNNEQAARSAITSGAFSIFGNGEGFKFLGDSEFAGKYKDREFFVTDAFLDQKTTNWENTTAVTFASQQASFIAAVGTAFYMTENATDFGGLQNLYVGFWGGQSYDSVNAFIAGFVDGIHFFNKTFAVKGNEIKISNAFLTTKEASYSGSWSEDTNATSMISNLTTGSHSADVLFPVAGGQVKSAIIAAKTSKGKLKIVGVDSDPKDAYGADAKYFITASIKNVDKATYEFSKLLFTKQTSNVLKLHEQNTLGVEGNFVSLSKGLLEKQNITSSKYKVKSVSGNAEAIYDYVIKNMNTQAANAKLKWNLSGGKIVTS